MSSPNQTIPNNGSVGSPNVHSTLPTISNIAPPYGRESGEDSEQELKYIKPRSLTRDSIWIGLVLGVVGPVLVLLGFWLMKFRGYALIDYLGMLRFTGTLTAVVSVAAVSNLGAFFFLLNRNQLRSTRGVLLATLALFLGMVAYKVVNGWQ